MNFDFDKLFDKDRIKLEDLIEKYKILEDLENDMKIADDQYEDLSAGNALDECNYFYNECIKIPWCNRCLHYQGCHSSIFGECWTCNEKGNFGLVQDNDWHYSNNEPLKSCEFYEFGEPKDTFVG